MQVLSRDEAPIRKLGPIAKLEVMLNIVDTSVIDEESDGRIVGKKCGNVQPKRPIHRNDSRHDSGTTNTTAKHSAATQGLALFSHGTLAIRTHPWVPVDTHSTRVYFRGGCGWAAVNKRTTTAHDTNSQTRQRSLTRKLRPLAEVACTILDNSGWHRTFLGASSVAKTKMLRKYRGREKQSIKTNRNPPEEQKHTHWNTPEEQTHTQKSRH